MNWDKYSRLQPISEGELNKGALDNGEPLNGGIYQLPYCVGIMPPTVKVSSAVAESFGNYDDLETLRWQNDWMESVIPGLLNKKLDPFVVIRTHDFMPKPKNCVTIAGVEPTDTEKAEIKAELDRRTKLIKELNSALREAKATRWKDHRKRLSDIMKARKYRENHKYAWVKYGELPAVLDTDKGRELLGRAINAGLLDNAYQPTSGTTNAQLCAIAMYVGDALDIRGKGFWEVFNSLWRKDHLQNTKWKPKDKQAKESKIQTVVNLFREYGEYPINGWK